MNNYTKFLVHGVKESCGFCKKTHEKPDFYTVYGVDLDGLEHAIKDFQTEKEAHKFAILEAIFNSDTQHILD